MEIREDLERFFNDRKFRQADEAYQLIEKSLREAKVSKNFCELAKVTDLWGSKLTDNARPG